MTDLYVSGDVETDGPIPGPFSMLSLGLAVAGSYDGAVFARRDPAADTFYAELRPIADAFEPDRVAATGLDRDALREHGREPAEALEEAAAWVRSVAGDRRPVFVGYPVVFDWMWLHWYFERFAGAGSPFGFSSALDIKTLYAVKARVTVGHAVKERMPRRLQPRRPPHPPRARRRDRAGRAVRQPLRVGRRSGLAIVRITTIRTWKRRHHANVFLPCAVPDGMRRGDRRDVPRRLR